MHHAHTGKHQDDRGKLEQEADEEHHGSKERHIRAQGDGIGNGVTHRVVHKEHQANGQHHEIAHGHAQIKQAGRHPEARTHGFLLVFVQRRRYETPDFVDHVRESHHQATEDGHFQVHKELGRYLHVDEGHLKRQAQG